MLTVDTRAADEQARLDALDSYDVLDTPPEEAFDRLTRLAQRLFDVPMSTITFIDGHRQWFKSRQGMSAQETDRGPALCNHALDEPGMLVVRDALLDSRFSNNRFVVGPPHIRFYAGVPLRTPDTGHGIGTLCVIDTRPREFEAADMEALADLGALVMSVLELRQHVVIDALTGALSRRAFRRELDRAVSLARRHKQELSCLMLDLDHFKEINDRYGHPAGDRVLAAAVAACEGHLRASDAIGRLGGEEFAVLLSMTRQTGAIEVGERLRASIAAMSVEHGGEIIRATASFGLATLNGTVPDADALLAHADEALYQAKTEGRNRLAIWAPTPTHSPATARRRVLKAGRISFNFSQSAIDCTVRFLSEDEAALDVVSTAGIPDSFKLMIDSDGTSRSCHVVTKQERHIVVAFDSP